MLHSDTINPNTIIVVGARIYAISIASDDPEKILYEWDLENNLSRRFPHFGPNDYEIISHSTMLGNTIILPTPETEVCDAYILTIDRHLNPTIEDGTDSQPDLRAMSNNVAGRDDPLSEYKHCSSFKYTKSKLLIFYDKRSNTQMEYGVRVQDFLCSSNQPSELGNEIKEENKQTESAESLTINNHRFV